MIDADKLTQAVANNIRPLCERYYPQGKLNGHEWKLGDVSGKAGDSFGIELNGPKAGVCNDRAGGYKGNFVGALMEKLGLKFPEVADEIGRALGQNFRISDFDWNSYRRLTKSDCERLCKWRGYSPKFIAWLVEHDLIRILAGKRWAFPIHVAGAIVGAHSRPIDWTGKNHVKWSFYPKNEDGGPGARPLIIGRLDQAETVHLSESTWDGLGVCDKLGIHQTDGACMVITRGCENTKFGRVVPKAVRTIYLWEQNDDPGREWTSNICEELPEAASVFIVATPAEHADVNDWIRAGATAADVLNAVRTAKEVEPQSTDKEREEPEDSIPRVVGFYDVSKKEYLIQNESGRWLSLNDAQFKLRLRNRGYRRGSLMMNSYQPASK